MKALKSLENFESQSFSGVINDTEQQFIFTRRSSNYDFLNASEIYLYLNVLSK